MTPPGTGVSSTDTPRRLTTKRLTLRPVTEEDLEVLLFLRNQPAVLETTATGAELPADRMQHQLDRWVALWRALGASTWIAELDGDPVAFVALDPLGDGYDEADPDDLELGVVVHPSHWGRGLAGEAALAVAADCFQRVGLRRLYATVDDVNVRSLAALAKAAGVELIATDADGERLYRLEAPVSLSRGDGV